ncbi:MAG: DNRLRE domain-containing protein [Nanoarchaeota archaeon]|nr:DNRLRE domain-containing protein [Nanoarchaeota archaeon]MBU4284260.1 DNRLRE domain-containing protein [Nanoarchaeota archaeon]MBU4493158.1 DNRLRE domain-containing protein [Nanoarchaeota archaeon]
MENKILGKKVRFFCFAVILLIFLLSIITLPLVTGYDDPGPITHKECVNGECKEVSGSGRNTCKYDSQCTHKECVNGRCESVIGQGINKCNYPSDCKDEEKCSCMACVGGCDPGCKMQTFYGDDCPCVDDCSECGGEGPDEPLVPTPKCGNNIKEYGEECDGTDVGYCTNGCDTNCKCKPSLSSVCTDSDNGKDYYKKGTGEGWNTDTEKVSFYDTCYKSYWANLVDSCEGNDCYLAEKYCDGKYVKTELSIPCPNGCNDGACIKGKEPYCSAIGTRSEGWYQNNKLIKWDNCKGCHAICKAIGTKSEGWYSSCTNSLIKYEKCGVTITNCVGEGEKGSVFNADPNDDVCCAGLEKIKDSVPISYPVKGCALSRSGFVCTNCGDGRCGLGENYCNCPEDCKEEEEIPCNTQEIFAKCDSLKDSYKSFSCKTVKPCGRYVLFSDITTSCPDILSTPYCSAGDCYGVKKDSTDDPSPQPECIKEGELGWPPAVCCKGLKNVGNSKPVNGVCTSYKNPSFVCTKCGDGNCGLGENYCNCPEDCKEETICTDSDGGKDYYVKGTASGEAYWKDEYVTKTDACYNCNNLAVTFDSCDTGPDCCVSDWYCNMDGKVSSASLNCPYGCEDGACIEEGTEKMKIDGRYLILNENFQDDVYSSPIAFYTGVLPIGKIVRTLINFDLSGLENKEIKKAGLVINKIPMLHGEEYGKQTTEVHKVMEKWYFHSASWNNQPRFDTTIVSSQEINENGKYTFDITQIMDYLIKHESGVLLKAENEEETNLKKFDEAYLNIWYTAEEEETKSCKEMGGNCRYLFGCKSDEAESDYECPFWGKCCMPYEPKCIDDDENCPDGCTIENDNDCEPEIPEIFDCGNAGPDNPDSETAGQCFIEKFDECSPANYSVSIDLGPLGGLTTYYYEIIGHENELCKMKTKYLAVINPEWVGKEMICNYNNSKELTEASQEVFDSFNEDEELGDCEGALYYLIKNPE